MVNTDNLSQVYPRFCCWLPGSWHTDQLFDRLQHAPLWTDVYWNMYKSAIAGFFKATFSVIKFHIWMLILKSKINKNTIIIKKVCMTSCNLCERSHHFHNSFVTTKLNNYSWHTIYYIKRFSNSFCHWKYLCSYRLPCTSHRHMRIFIKNCPNVQH